MVRDPGLVMRGTGWMIARRLTGGGLPTRYYCLEMRLQGRPRLVCTRLGLQIVCWLIGRRTSDTWGTIYPASGPRRENPTCCLSDLVLMMMYRGAVRALVERDLYSPMRGG